jgi:simple sugar transport system ATP-binding protein
MSAKQDSQLRYLVEMKDIVKHFPGVLANDHTYLGVRPGEIHALLGENGAGKSTLMNILSGLYQPDAGEIRVKGDRVDIRSTRDAIQAGIGMVHQHFSLVDVFSVSENVMIGLDTPGLRLELGEVEEALRSMGESYGLKVNPRAKIWQLSVGEQQRVEILKLLYRDVELLILDEPTAVLTPQEAEELARVLRQMTESGKAVLYISHKLREVLSVADKITVLRDGKNVGTVDAEDVNETDLSRMMVGSEVLPMPTAGKEHPYGPVFLSTRDLWVKGNRNVDAVRGLDLELRSGEIFGIAGVAGNGQRELAEAVTGLRKVESGKILVDEEEITNHSPRAIIEKGVSLIPEDCKEMGLISDLGIYENAILKNYRQFPVSNGLVLNLRKVREYAHELVKEFNVRTPDLDEPVWKLSGGNLQRLLLGREIKNKPRVLIAANPTRGLDIQAATEIRRILLEQREEGAGILLISEDLDEIVSISDRIAVIYEGRLIGEVSSEEATIHDLGLMMMGTQASEI